MNELQGAATGAAISLFILIVIILRLAYKEKRDTKPTIETKRPKPTPKPKKPLIGQEHDPFEEWHDELDIVRPWKLCRILAAEQVTDIAPYEDHILIELGIHKEPTVNGERVNISGNELYLILLDYFDVPDHLRELTITAEVGDIARMDCSVILSVRE